MTLSDPTPYDDRDDSLNDSHTVPCTHCQDPWKARAEAAEAQVERVRALHYAAYADSLRTPICSDCHGKAGTHPCGCWSPTDIQPVCAACREGYKFVAVDYPCPTVRLLDAIDTTAGRETT